MKDNTKCDFEDPDFIRIRLNQIQKSSKVTVTHNNINVYYQISYNGDFDEEIPKYEKNISYSELVSLVSAFIVLEIESGQEIKILCKQFWENLKYIKEIQKKIQFLYNCGKNYVFEDYFDRSKQNKNIIFSIDRLINIYTFQEVPKYTLFLKRDIFLYFGSLLQRNDLNKIETIIQKMFQLENNETLKKNILDAFKKDYINDPMICSIHFLSSIYSKYMKLPSKKSKFQHGLFDFNFKGLQDQLLVHFFNHNFIVIKVNKPFETLHVLRIISCLLYNDNNHVPLFYENFFCFEDSDIQSYLTDLSQNEINIQYSFIVHPEFLSNQNQNLLKEKIVYRMKPIPDMSLPKLVIITSSPDFIFGEKAGELKGNIFTLVQNNINVDSSIMRNYFPKEQKTYFNIQIRQSLQNENESIKKEIEKITENKQFKFRVFNHFIDDDNHKIPIESFNAPSDEYKNIIHFQFSEKVMMNGIKFWSQLYQLYSDGFVMLQNNEPLLINSMGCNLVFFEIPKINDDFYLNNLNLFPLPVSSKFVNEKNSFFSEIYSKPITIKDTFINYRNDAFVDSSNKQKYYRYGIDLVLNSLRKKPKIGPIKTETDEEPTLKKPVKKNEEEEGDYDDDDDDDKNEEEEDNKHHKTKKEDENELNQTLNVKEYIELMFNIIFNSKNEFNNYELSYQKALYIEKYLYKYTKLYINSIPDTQIDQTQFAIFFYMLTVSAIYMYNCLPKKKNTDKNELGIYKVGYGITFITVENMFSTEINNKRINFFTSKKQEEILKHLKDVFNKCEPKYFTIHYECVDNKSSHSNLYVLFLILQKHSI